MARRFVIACRVAFAVSVGATVLAVSAPAQGVPARAWGGYGDQTVGWAQSTPESPDTGNGAAPPPRVYPGGASAGLVPPAGGGSGVPEYPVPERLPARCPVCPPGLAGIHAPAAQRWNLEALAHTSTGESGNSAGPEVPVPAHVPCPTCPPA
jgi:hypothetical protein